MSPVIIEANHPDCEACGGRMFRSDCPACLAALDWEAERRKQEQQRLRNSTAEERAKTHGMQAFRNALRTEVDAAWERMRAENEALVLNLLEHGPIRIPLLPWWRVAP